MSEDPSKRTPPPISSSDPRRAGRYDKVTVPEMTSIPTLLGEIQAAMTEGFVRVNANIDATHEAIDGITDRVTRLEEAAAKSRSGPQKTYSGQIDAVTGKVAQISDSDLKQNSIIAQLLTTQAATDAKVDALVTSQSKQTEALASIATAVTGWAKEHPTLTNGLVALVTAAMLWATSWLQSKGH